MVVVAPTEDRWLIRTFGGRDGNLYDGTCVYNGWSPDRPSAADYERTSVATWNAAMPRLHSTTGFLNVPTDSGVVTL